MDQCNDALLDQVLPTLSSKFIHIEAWTISIEIEYMPEGSHEWINEPTYSRWNGNVSGYFAVFKSYETTLQVPIYSSYQMYEKDTAEQQSLAPFSEQGELLGIVLDRCEYRSRSHGTSTFVMIV